MNLTEKIMLAERIAHACKSSDSHKQVAMYAIDIIVASLKGSGYVSGRPHGLDFGSQAHYRQEADLHRRLLLDVGILSSYMPPQKDSIGEAAYRRLKEYFGGSTQDSPRPA